MLKLPFSTWKDAYDLYGKFLSRVNQFIVLASYHRGINGKFALYRYQDDRHPELIGEELDASIGDLTDEWMVTASPDGIRFLSLATSRLLQNTSCK